MSIQMPTVIVDSGASVDDREDSMQMLRDQIHAQQCEINALRKAIMYTHPVKEQDTDCQYCKQGCIRCDARKQLTDEEIIQVMMNVYSDTVPPIRGIDFAKAILRKAQEK